MPGFVTHYLFGCKCVEEISNIEINKIIKKYKKAYSIGLQGPDIFFYYPYSFTGMRKRIGSVMHVYETGKFLFNLANETSKLGGESRDIAIAYFCGFIGHYIMDTTCHPYIYYSTGYLNKNEPYIGKHVDFETDIDKLLLDKLYGRDVLDFRQDYTIKLSKQERKIIAFILNNSCKKTYPEIVSNSYMLEHVLVNFRYINSMLKDPKGWKNKIVLGIEKCVLGHPQVSPLLVVGGKKSRWSDPLNNNREPWYNPWDTQLKSNESFIDLIEAGKKKYIDLVEKLYLQYFQNINTNIDYNDFIDVVGNNSYHSGLDCSIPS